MKNKILFFLFSFVLTIIHIGCATTVSNFQEAEVFGPQINNTVKITQNKKRGDIDLNLNFSLNNVSSLSSSVDGHSLVNSNNIYQLEPVEGEEYFLEYGKVNIFEFEGENIIWEIPKIHSLINVDLALSNHFGITAGVNYSQYKNEDYWGNNIGIAYFNLTNSWAYRFDAILSFQDMRFNSTYVTAEDKILSSSETRKVYIITDEKKEKYGNVSFMFTINSNEDEWPVNVFFSYKVGSQTFYETSVDKILFDTRIGDFDYEESFQAFSLGIYQDVFDFGRLILGYKYTTYSDQKNNFSIPQAFVQYDFRIF